mmetsp:Transcript_62678/g.152579  ORF Transcript_62678/g.152579 Transcript_62678/m.152579 type:complete len:1219 (+) Transcript_62678:11-3667(+)
MIKMTNDDNENVGSSLSHKRINSNIGATMESVHDNGNVGSSVSSHEASNSNSGATMESVLVVPLKLCKTAQNIVFDLGAAPLGHHLDGRYGSRTHKIDDEHMGIPIMDAEYVLKLATDQHEDGEQHNNNELKGLLQQPGVSIQRRPYSIPPPHRAIKLEELDSRHHPDRATSQERSDCEELWRQLYEENRNKKANSEEEEEDRPTLNPPLPEFTYAELFAGTGAFGVALRALGGRCVFVSELEEHLREVFCHNFPGVDKETEVWGDITKVPDEAFPSTLDLLVGGFPCQPFSSMGQQPGFECEKRGNLFLDIARCLKVSQPKAFLLENVPGLLTMTETYDIIVRTLEEVGYNVTSEVISSRGLTSTKRKRLYIVGLRKDLEQQDGVDPFLFPYIPDLSLRARDVLDYDDLPQSELDIIRLAGDTLQQFLTSRRFKRKNMAWPNTVCSTIISHYGNAVGRGESQLVPCAAPHAPRRFSIRECARLMGFPNWYKFLPPREHQSPMAYRKEHYRMVGNAVCPPVIASISGAVLDRIMVNVPADIDYVSRGRRVAMQLAAASLRPGKRAPLPIGCLLPTEYDNYGYTLNNATPVEVVSTDVFGRTDGEGKSHFPCKRKVSFGNPALGTYGGYVYTLPQSSSTQKRPPLVEGAEAVDQMCAFIDVPPEHVPEGILDVIRSHREYIETVRVVIAEPETNQDANNGIEKNNDLDNICQEDDKRNVVQGDIDAPESTSRTYIVLFQLASQEAVDGFVNDLDGRPYIPFDDTEVCSVQYVVAMEGEDGVSLRSGPNFAPLRPGSSKLADNSISGVGSDTLAAIEKTVLQMTHAHDQNCAVCLENLASVDGGEHEHGSPKNDISTSTVTSSTVPGGHDEADKRAILTTVCNHTFHLDCLVKCSGPCPVCRYDHSGLNETLSQCHVCGTTENNFVCLICGVVSCVGSLRSSSSVAVSASAAAPASSSSKSSLPAATSSSQGESHRDAGQTRRAVLENNNHVGTAPDASAVSAHRFHHSHAAQHYNETLHAYALDTQTQHVWDFAGQGYVHRLLQNKEDGKLVEMNDPFNNNSNERTLTPGLSDTQEGEVLHRKLENYASQYYTLLKSQLEQQRTFYEGRLQEIRRDFATKKRDEEKSKDELVVALRQEKKQLSHRLHLLQKRCDKVSEDSKFLQNMNESLEKNLPALKVRIKEAQRERIESRKMFQETLPSLEEKLSALMLQLEDSTNG